MNPQEIGVKAAGENLSLLVDLVYSHGEEIRITNRHQLRAVLINPDTLAELRQPSPHPGGGAHVCSCGRLVQ